ncbi:unnamed protein product [Arctogadus glacialis]
MCIISCLLNNKYVPSFYSLCYLLKKTSSAMTRQRKTRHYCVSPVGDAGSPSRCSLNSVSKILFLENMGKTHGSSKCQINQQYGISVDVYEGKEEEDLVDSRRYVLSGLDDCCPSDTISMYIHSCSQRADHSWEAVGGDSIVVTFKEDIG